LSPRSMDSLVGLVEALELLDSGVAVPALARSLGSCGTPTCRLLLGDPPDVPPAPSALALQQRLLLSRLLDPPPGVVLAPDGSSVALGPLFAGLEVGLARASGQLDRPTDPPLDALFAVTVTEALATSFLAARGGGRAALGPDGCWDDVENPQNYSLRGPSSLVPEAVANGAMDGLLLGLQLARAPVPLAELLRGYYGTGNGTEKGRPPSSSRRRDFGGLVGPEKLQEEVAAALRLLRDLPTTRELLQDVGPGELVAIAHRAARDFMELYVACPAVVPRCMWGARPYRGSPRLLTLPLDSVYIHHTFIPSSPCRSFSSCARALRSIQRFHQDVRGWDDIGYSFVVGSDGYVYQGRGWHWVGAHTKGYNSRGYGVGYVGDFSTAPPDADALALVRDGLLPCAVSTGRLRRNHSVRGHRQMGHTDCPGNSLFREIETWNGFQ
ncbi:PGRP2 amidase, partial [Piaya cayana]|nr:PGRP2 amidase [Piaya cayana]